MNQGWYINTALIILNQKKQSGAELCQAQAQLSLDAEAELNVTVEFQVWVSRETAYNYI